jgi:hypothetical protein
MSSRNIGIGLRWCSNLHVHCRSSRPEQGVLTDLDCAVEVSDKNDKFLTERTVSLKESCLVIYVKKNQGTPSFVAISVSTGRARFAQQRPKFPELPERAAHLYEKAYGKSVLEKYPEIINSAPLAKIFVICKEDIESAHLHTPTHDVESFYWVLLYELVRAWPEGEESDGMTGFAEQFLEIMSEHDLKHPYPDFRMLYLNPFPRMEVIEALLHPRLRKLAPLLAELTSYIAVEWTHWIDHDLPADHCHEAMKRILLKMLLEIEDDAIELKVGIERRRKPRNLPKVYTNYESYGRPMPPPAPRTRTDSTQSTSKAQMPKLDQVSNKAEKQPTGNVEVNLKSPSGSDTNEDGHFSPEPCGNKRGREDQSYRSLISIDRRNDAMKKRRVQEDESASPKTNGCDVCFFGESAREGDSSAALSKRTMLANIDEEQGQ